MGNWARNVYLGHRTWAPAVEEGWVGVSVIKLCRRVHLYCAIENLTRVFDVVF